MSKFHAAAMAQDLKNTMRLSDGWPKLRPDEQEALDRIQSAIGGILAGDDSEDFCEVLAAAHEVFENESG